MALLQLKYVNSFIDRHGRRRYYLRRPGCKAVPLPGLPGSSEFMDAYQTAFATEITSKSEIGVSRTAPGTINALVTSAASQTHENAAVPANGSIT
jgi:hypothetical protein